MIWYSRYASIAFLIGAIIKFKQKQYKEACTYLLFSTIIIVCIIFIPELVIYPFRG